MRVFLTGASGFVGSAVLSELVAAGHSVLGLVRSDAGAAKVTKLGGEALHGDLFDLACVRRGASQCDAVIHCGFNHDFSQYVKSCEDDRLVIRALAEEVAQAGGNKALLVTSALGLVTSSATAGQVASEETPCAEGHPRGPNEQAALDFVARGVRVVIVRLPPTVHDLGDAAFVPMLAATAREKKLSAYVGEGANRWPAVHRLDAARLYRLALEKGAAGTRVHAAGEEAVPFKDIATTLGQRLNVPVASVGAGAEAAAHFGFLAAFTQLDNPVSTQLTRERLGWQPTQCSLLEDIKKEAYLSSTKAS